MREHERLAKSLRKAGSILILGHQNSDPDAVCSAYALSALARQINKRLKVSFSSPDGVSKRSKQILESIQLEVVDTPSFTEPDLIITVDTNTLQQLGAMKDQILHSAKPIIMIDHHAPHSENIRTATLVLCDEKSTSTCEMILDIYEKLHLTLTRKVSQALLTGLLAETGQLTIATRRTYKSAYMLVEAGGDPQAALALTRTMMDDSERIARLKTAQRARVERVDKWLVALSEVGSYHASAARALIGLGAHLAIVAGKRNHELTVSLRSTREFNSETGLHLGTNLANPLGAKMMGMGGGHATAAGANAKGDANEALRLALSIVREFLHCSPKYNTGLPEYTADSAQSSVITQKQD